MHIFSSRLYMLHVRFPRLGGAGCGGGGGGGFTWGSSFSQSDLTDQPISTNVKWNNISDLTGPTEQNGPFHFGFLSPEPRVCEKLLN